MYKVTAMVIIACKLNHIYFDNNYVNVKPKK